jgi:L-ascorbate metabolism protein UlaG (beta-lactamase superfamily)
MADGARIARRAGSTAEGAADSSTESAADRIVYLGHATVLIEVDGVRLLTDPLLRGHVAHLRRQTPPVRESAFSGIDAVLISHLHYDHLDLASLRLLGLDTPLLVPAGAGELLRGRGFTDVTELNVGEVANVGAVAVAAVAAHHDGRRWVGPGSLRAETLGYVVRGRRTVYFAGDTELFDGMAAMTPPPDRDDRSDSSPQLDVALLPVAGWGSTLGPGHMDPLDAARAAGLLRPRIAIPVHWGTLSPIGVARWRRERLGDPPRLFAEHVASIAPNVEARILAPGQETTL